MVGRFSEAPTIQLLGVSILVGGLLNAECVLECFSVGVGSTSAGGIGLTLGLLRWPRLKSASRLPTTSWFRKVVGARYTS